MPKIEFDMTEEQCAMLRRGLRALEMEARHAMGVRSFWPDLAAAALETILIASRAVDSACPSAAHPEEP